MMTLKQVAENHGLTPDGVDYALRQYQIILCEITGGMLSKLSYDAHDVLTYAQDRWCEKCDLKAQEPVEPEKLTVLDYGSMESGLYLCGACRMPIGNGDKFCKHCGKKVKWKCD